MSNVEQYFSLFFDFYSSNSQDDTDKVRERSNIYDA